MSVIDTADRPELTFWLGTGNPSWLASAGVPLFVSDTRLRTYKTLPVAVAPAAVDSGGFQELQRYGTWTVPPHEYAARVRRYRDAFGPHLRWAAPQDWMCEPAIIHGGWHGGQYFVGTHRSVAEHQARTVLNAAHLRQIAPDLPWIYVVQGDTPDAYVRCVDLYWSLCGIDLATEPLVGVGSVCRRQSMPEAGRILTVLHRRGLRRLHGFGFKTLGLLQFGHLLVSADSQAWSRDARYKQRPVCGQVHPRGAKNCANCLPYALHWRHRLLHQLTPDSGQLSLWDTDKGTAA